MINQYPKSHLGRLRWSLLRVMTMPLLKSRQLATIMYTERVYKWAKWQVTEDSSLLTLCSTWLIHYFPLSSLLAILNLQLSVSPPLSLHLSLYCQVKALRTFLVAPLSFQQGWHSVLLGSPQFLYTPSIVSSVWVPAVVVSLLVWRVISSLMLWCPKLHTLPLFQLVLHLGCISNKSSTFLTLYGLLVLLCRNSTYFVVVKFKRGSPLNLVLVKKWAWFSVIHLAFWFWYFT